MDFSLLLVDANVNSELYMWILKQTPLVALMGVVIYWLAKRYEKEKASKDELARDVIKISTLWEEKADKMAQKEIKIDDLIYDYKIMSEKLSVLIKENNVMMEDNKTLLLENKILLTQLNIKE